MTNLYFLHFAVGDGYTYDGYESFPVHSEMDKDSFILDAHIKLISYHEFLEDLSIKLHKKPIWKTNEEFLELCKQKRSFALGDPAMKCDDFYYFMMSEKFDLDVLIESVYTLNEFIILNERYRKVR